MGLTAGLEAEGLLKREREITSPQAGRIAVRQGNILAITFHPELSRDTRIHAAVLGFGTA